MFDDTLLRDEFPQAPGMLYLNHAAVAPWPKRTGEAVAAFARENIFYGAARYPLFAEKEEHLRRQLKALINAPSTADIALLKNTSEAVSVVASGLRWRPGDNVVSTAEEFPSNRIPWEAQRAHGVSLKPVDVRGETPEQALMDACDERTRVLAVSSVQFSSGIRLDLAPLGDFCRRRGILFCVDAIQSIGAQALDAQAIQAHFVMADGHKWMLGPEGLALFYVDAAVREELTLHQHGWHMTATPDDFDSGSWRPAASARRFEAGSNNLLGIHALSASLGLFEELGMAAVEAALAARVMRLAEGLARLPRVRLLTPAEPARRAGIVTFLVDGANHQQLHRQLLGRRVVCASRGGGIRFSPHFYTSDAVIDAALEALAEEIQALAPG